MSTSDSSCKDGASKSNDDDVCEVMGKLSTADNKDSVVSVCANCGKEDNNLKSCTACKMVKYCNRECQIAHRKQHKKECKKRAAELHDEELFKQPPPAEDCPICLLLLPSHAFGFKYQTCCGKLICSGCIYAPVYDDQGNKVAKKTCPFCRTPQPKSNGEAIKRVKKRVEIDGDAIATHNHGIYYSEGMYGFEQDYTKALELWHRAAELGYTEAYCSIGYAYEYGEGVEVDKKKSVYYYELAAMGGSVRARYNLGNNEGKAGNIERAWKHLMIAVGSGQPDSLERIKQMYTNGYVTKDDYTKALQSYQAYLGEIKSDARDTAAAYSDELRYY